MTRDELVEAGERLFGPAWTAPLAVALGLPARTVRAWAEGRLPVGADKARFVARLLAAAGRRPADPPSLAHLTMNTGDLVRSPRDEVRLDMARWLAPMVAAGKGEPAGIRFVIDRQGEGAALFRLGRPSAVACGLCWREDRAPEVWGRLLAVVDVRGVRVIPAERPPVPWLATVLLAAPPPEAVERLADLARAIAWVLLERATGS